MSIKSYSYNDKTQLTKNFNVSEFRCKCGKTHNIKISTELVNQLQKMADYIGVDSVIISSGHRCAEYDRKVGGSSSGPHVDGYAADCKFMKNGKFINTKYLSCIAQDLGFNGIANITSDYQWIHLDMKGRIYKGNEIINYHTLTNNFYSYYGLTKNDILNMVSLKNSTNNSNNNKSSTSNTSKINNKDKKSSKFIYSNKYDEKIKELQNIFIKKGYSLIADGYAGPNTYNVCKKFTIEKRDSGPLTRWVQERLKQKGYYKDICDGIAGINTMNAIKSFQKDNKLGQGYLGGTDWYYLIK